MFSVYPLWRIAMPARVDLHATPLSWFDHPTHRHRHFYHLLSSLPLASVYPLSSLLLHTFLLSYLSLSFFPVSSIIRTLFLSLSLSLLAYLVLLALCLSLSTCLCRARSIVLVVRRNPNREIYIYIFAALRGTRAGFREPSWRTAARKASSRFCGSQRTFYIWNIVMHVTRSFGCIFS